MHFCHLFGKLLCISSVKICRLFWTELLSSNPHLPRASMRGPNKCKSRWQVRAFLLLVYCVYHQLRYSFVLHLWCCIIGICPQTDYGVTPVTYKFQPAKFFTILGQSCKPYLNTSICLLVQSLWHQPIRPN